MRPRARVRNRGATTGIVRSDACDSPPPRVRVQRLGLFQALPGLVCGLSRCDGVLRTAPRKALRQGAGLLDLPRGPGARWRTSPLPCRGKGRSCLAPGVCRCQGPRPYDLLLASRRLLLGPALVALLSPFHRSQRREAGPRCRICKRHRIRLGLPGGVREASFRAQPSVQRLRRLLQGIDQVLLVRLLDSRRAGDLCERARRRDALPAILTLPVYATRHGGGPRHAGL